MRTNVIVVDDSAFMRSEIQKILEADPALTVVATAENGQEAIDAVKAYKPDVVTMDINMPVMDGITSLKRIMAESPCPVIMVSALTHESAEETIEALASGAFDFFHKPSGSISLDISRQAEQIREKVKAAAQSKRLNRLKRKPWNTIRRTIPAISKIRQAIRTPRGSRITRSGSIVAIGVSTGGPRTLMSILPEIQPGFPGAVVIAQHMPEKFTLSLADRLNSICPLPVREARHGDILQNGQVYIAPGGKHIKVINQKDAHYTIEVVTDPVPSFFIPSIELLFRSLLEAAGNQWLGIMLTGMGSDGAQALSDLRKIGGHTIVESKESCTVFGMPRRVIELDGAEFTLHENQIIDKMVELIGN